MNTQIEMFAPPKNRIRRFALLAFYTFLISFTWACSDETGADDKGNISGVDTATLTVTPGSVDFDLINLGETDQRSITISNTGSGTLRISSIEIIKNGAPNANKFNKVGDWEPRNLKTNESFDLTVEYAPVDPVSDSGAIRIRSNGSAGGTHDIPIRTTANPPQIFTPRTISFERVAPNTTESQIAIVQNIGRSPLIFQDIILTGSSAFSISFPDPNVSIEENNPETDTDNWPSVLEPDESFPIRVYFAPGDTEPANSELVFYTNDPNDPQYKVDVIGNSGAACMNVTDEALINFGASPIGRTSRRAITIENCSAGSELVISAIEISDDGGGKFDVPAEFLPPGLLDEPIKLRPRETTNFTVTYDPTDEVEDEGSILIKSNDPIKSSLTIPVKGKGSHVVCPEAIAEARIAGTTQYKDELLARPLQNIEFSGTRSSGSSQLTYEWSVRSRPSNSQSRFTPNNTVAEPRLWLDLAGDYEIELVVYDADGLASCEPSIVTIHVVPSQEIHIQLTWFTPAVPSPRNGNGTDVDLHYRHPQGTKWNDRTYTVYWNSKASGLSWGSTPALANKATLDIDDLWGVTTENINHVQPLNGNYEIGVHYYADNGRGGTDATLRIYVQGVLKYELLDKRLQNKQFWRVGSLQWPSGDMIWVDQVVCDHTLAGFPNTTCR